MAVLHQVLDGEVAVAWGKGAAHFIQRALDHANGEFLLSDVEARVAGGAWQLWVAVEAGHIVGAAATQIVHYPQMIICEIVYFSSSLPREEWTALFGEGSELEHWAKYVGCTRVMLHGRAGFERVKPDHGYSKWYVCMGKTLSA
jgi:hypothetical protein